MDPIHVLFGKKYRRSLIGPVVMKLRQIVVTANGPIVSSDTTKWFHSRKLVEGSCVTNCKDTGGLEKSRLIVAVRGPVQISIQHSPITNLEHPCALSLS